MFGKRAVNARGLIRKSRRELRTDHSRRRFEHVARDKRVAWRRALSTFTLTSNFPLLMRIEELIIEGPPFCYPTQPNDT